VSRGATTRSQYVLLASQLSRFGVSLGIAAMLGRTLSPRDFGLVALVSTIFLVAQELLDMGTTGLACREITRRPADEESILSALLGWRRLFSIPLAAVAAGLVFGPFAIDDQPTLAVSIVIGIFLLHYSAYHVVFQVHQAFGKAALLGLSIHLVFFAACAVALGFAATGTVIALLVVAREIVQVISSRWVAQRMIGYRLKSPPFDRDWMPLWRMAWMFGLAGVFYKLSISAGTFFVWTFAGPDALGVYNAAQRIVSPVRDIAWIFATPLIATMSVGFGKDPDVMAAQLARYVCLLIGAAAVIAVCGILLAPSLLHLFYGRRYDGPTLSATTALRWQVAAACVAVITPLLIVDKLARGRERELLAKSLTCFVLGCVAHRLTVPAFGANGASAITAATELSVLVALWMPMPLACQARLLARLFAYAIPAAGMTALLVLLAPWPIPQFIVACVLAPMVLVLLWQLPEQRAGRASLHRTEAELARTRVGALHGGSAS